MRFVSCKHVVQRHAAPLQWTQAACSSLQQQLLGTVNRFCFWDSYCSELAVYAQEAMRMKPAVASGTMRVCQKDCTLGNGRCTTSTPVVPVIEWPETCNCDDVETHNTSAPADHSKPMLWSRLHIHILLSRTTNRCCYCTRTGTTSQHRLACGRLGPRYTMWTPTGGRQPGSTCLSGGCSQAASTCSLLRPGTQTSGTAVMAAEAA